MPEQAVPPAAGAENPLGQADIVMGAAGNLDFRSRVETILNDTLGGLTDAPSFALLHYYWGNHEERGAVRMSAIRPEFLPEGQPLMVAFQRHLMQFGPHFSLLRWVYFFAVDTQTPQTALPPIRFEMTEGSPLASPITEGLSLHVKYNAALAERLVPPGLLESHRQNLATGFAAHDLRKDFAVALGHARGLLDNDSARTAMELGRFLPNHEQATPERCQVDFLAALQSARGFLDSIAPPGGRHIMDFHCAFAGGHEPPLRSATLFTLQDAQGGHSDITRAEAVQTRLQECLGAVEETVQQYKATIPNAFNELACEMAEALIYEDPDAVEKTYRPNWNRALTALDQGFHLREFHNWRDCVLVWMTSLICNLREKVHEGKRLEFWLAAGDLAEVLDSGRFELTRAEAEHLSAVAVPPDSGVARDARPDARIPAQRAVNRARETAVRVASKENYVWFAKARHALFWDLTSLGRAPVGLLRPVDGNWEWYLEQRHKNMGRADWPELVLAYVREDGSGGVTIGAEHVDALAEQETRVHFVLGLIRDWQQEVVGVQVGDEFDLLSELIVRIADDRKQGCAVVFAAQDPTSVFMKMGYPWGLWNPNCFDKSRLEEIKRFMEMDGATCVWWDQTANCWKIDSQFLLHGNEAVVSRWIPRVRDRHDLRLRGAGARRWSAAVAASHPSVGLVVVASQDRDIYAFRSRPGDELQMIESRGDAQGGDAPSWELLIEGDEA